MKLKLQTKEALKTNSLLLVVCILIIAISLNMTKNRMSEIVGEKTAADIVTLSEIVELTYAGDWEVNGKALFKGNFTIDNAIVDSLAEMTHGDVTFFAGDVRVATTVKNNDQRVIGTKASEKVVNIVLNQGKMYTGQADVVGKSYQTAYLPLRDKNGNVVGMMFTGNPNNMGALLSSKYIITLIGTVLIIQLIGGALGWVFSRRLTQSIKSIAKVTEEVAAGQLMIDEVVLKSEDEVHQLASSFGKMTKQLREVVGKVAFSSEQLAAASEELFASSDQASEAANTVSESMNKMESEVEHQIEGISQTFGVVEHISLAIDRVAKESNATAGLSEQAVAAAGHGSTSVQSAIVQMHKIEQTVEESAEVVQKLGERSIEIDQIVQTIAGIAEQTNLLALNAAIEAARAGEHGKGFSVVADEVRKLAGSSQTATRQIADLIKVIQQETNDAVTSMNDGYKEVKLGAQVINSTGEVFADIAQVVNQVSERVQEVSATIQEMASSSRQMLLSMQEISTISQGTLEQFKFVSSATEEQLASMEHISSASQSLAEMAQELQVVVGSFKL